MKKHTTTTFASLSLFFSICFLQGSAQNKFSFRAIANTHFSYGKRISKEKKIPNQPLTVIYPTKRNEKNPFLDLDFQATYGALKNLNLGLQSGVQFHFKEPFFYYKRHYIAFAFPVLGVINYKIPIVKKLTTGVTIKGGLSIFELNSYISRTRNASLFTIGTYAEVAKKLRLEIGLEQQNDFSTSYNDNPDGSFSKLFKYRTKMNSINIGISYKVFINS